MRILVSGSTGLVGSAVADVLAHQGHEIVRLVRPGTVLPKEQPTSPAEPKHVVWNPGSGILDSRAEGADALIHLAGASIAGHRWTQSWKRELRESRVAATRSLDRFITPFSPASANLHRCIGHRLLWKPRRRGTDRVQSGRERFSRSAHRRLGSGVLARFGIRGARRRSAIRDHSRQTRRSPSPYRAPVSLGFGRKNRFRPPVDVLDRLGRYRRNHSLLVGSESSQRSGQRRGAYSRAKCGVYCDARTRPAQARDSSCAWFRVANGAGRNGRFASARQPKGLSRQASKAGISVPLSGIAARSGSHIPSSRLTHFAAGDIQLSSEADSNLDTPSSFVSMVAPAFLYF